MAKILKNNVSAVAVLAAVVGMWTRGACAEQAAPAAPAAAEVKLNGLFSDHMVLQRGSPLPVWGSAPPGGTVVVTLAGQERRAQADAKGQWRVAFEPLAAGGPFEMKIAGPNSFLIQDVWIGDVWLCSGQSNMLMPLAQAANAQPDIQAAANPMLRFLKVPERRGYETCSDLPAHWTLCTPETAAGFSAAGYYFGREVQRTQKVALGLILSAVNGSKAEEWTSRAGLLAHPVAEKVVRLFDEYRAAVETAARTGGAKPGRFRAHPAVLYNGMLAPLQPYSIRGVAWYQGESFTGRAPYVDLMTALIASWRKEFERPELPFLMVQLAPFMAIPTAPQESGWAEQREAQVRVAQTVPHTALAVIVDAGDAKNVHPPRKAVVGERLALAARGLAYGERLEYRSPLYAGLKIEGQCAVLSFTNLGAGLVAKDGALRGFTLADENRVFVNAQAEIRGDTVAVWNDAVAKPVAVRMGWATYPDVNLWSKAGLPASPFRTDDWPRAGRVADPD